MILQESTTIAAIATPPGYGGIGIIRLSGPDALSVVRRLLPNGGNLSFTPNRTQFFSLVDEDSKTFIDQALITYFAAPRSFTGEDVVEISTHGSPVVLNELLRLLLSFGVEAAQPGEFTFRAFLNGRMDLAQAEAVNDLIHATTVRQARVAAGQLHGELSKQIKPLKDALVRMIVSFESSVEFVEDNLDQLDIEHFSQELSQLIATLTQMISSYRLGRLIRTGIKLALIGRPNVGKSSIFNKLLGRDRAIVTDIPGTTRDTLTENFSLHGIPIELIDTAGVRETEDIIERLGVERTQSAIAEADFVIAVIEANISVTEQDQKFFGEVPFHLLVINKCDLGEAITSEVLKTVSQGKPVLHLSAFTGQGIDALRQHLYTSLTSGVRDHFDGGIITNERHYHALENALADLRQAHSDLSSGFTEEVLLVHFHRALSSLGMITGETLIADIINQIFSTFCIGK